MEQEIKKNTGSKKWIAPVIILAVVAVAGIFVYSKLGFLFGGDKDLGLLSLSNITNQSAEYQEFQDEKQSGESKLKSMETFVGRFNDNENLTKEIKDAFGSKFYIYLYTVAEFQGARFKVIEWSVEFTDGNVTKYEQGRLFNQVDETHIVLWIDHPTFMYMIENQVGTTELLDLVTSGKIKISPGRVTFKVVGLLPELLKVLA